MARLDGEARAAEAQAPAYDGERRSGASGSGWPRGVAVEVVGGRRSSRRGGGSEVGELGPRRGGAAMGSVLQWRSGGKQWRKECHWGLASKAKAWHGARREEPWLDLARRQRRRTDSNKLKSIQSDSNKFKSFQTLTDSNMTFRSSKIFK
jgi:hypothetical protein